MTTTPLEQAELDEFLDDAEAPPDYYLDTPGWHNQPGTNIIIPDPLTRSPWVPTDDGAAEWCLRKLAKVRTQLVAANRLAEDRISNVRSWLLRSTTPLKAEEERWGELLKDYALRRRQETTRRSFELPSGYLTTKARAACVVIEDEAALAAFLATPDRKDLQAEWCKIEPKPLVTKIRDDSALGIADGSICRYCDAPIVREAEYMRQSSVAGDGTRTEYPLRWNCWTGLACTSTSQSAIGGHDPVLVDGEELVVRLAVLDEDPGLGRIPVPGLAVQAESVTAKVEVSYED